MEQFNLAEYLENPTGRLSQGMVVSRGSFAQIENMSEEFHSESCYIDVAHGDGLVVLFEKKFDYVAKSYPVSHIIGLIERGVTCITPDQLTSI